MSSSNGKVVPASPPKALITWLSPKTSRAITSPMASPDQNANTVLSSQLEKLFREFDRGLVLQVMQTKRAIGASLDRLSSRITRAEANCKYMTERALNNCERELQFADGLVTKELRSKILTSQWTSAFLADSTFARLDPLTFAYSRFSMNICLSYKDVDPKYLIDLKVHEQLIIHISSQNEAIVGPALMALTHVSLLPAMRPLIIHSSNCFNVALLPIVLKILIQSNAKLILSQACKLLASLALHFPNKAQIVNSGCFHGIVDLIIGTGKRAMNIVTAKSSPPLPGMKGNIHVPKLVQLHALIATVNVINGSDANRSLAVELEAIHPIIHSLRFSSSKDITIQCAKALANICYGNSHGGMKVLGYGGDEALLEAIFAEDFLRKPEVTSVCLAAISNMCTSEANQSQLGGANTSYAMEAISPGKKFNPLSPDSMKNSKIRGEGLVDVIIRIIEFSRDASLVTEAAKTALALSWRHVANKARLCGQGACATILKRLIRHFNDFESKQNEMDLCCIEMLAAAMASMLLNISNHPIMTDLGGVEEICRMCKSSTNARVLSSLSTILAAMVPTPELLYRYHIEAHIPPIESAGGLAILRKIRVIGFGHLPNPPAWLEMSIIILSKTDQALQHQETWVKSEFVDDIVFWQEFTTELEPDADVMSDLNVKGFLFSLY